MADIRRVLIIFVIGVLFSIFVFSFIEAVYPNPDYQDFCLEESPYMAKPLIDREECVYLEPSTELTNSCEEKGDLKPVYENGCIINYECDSCRREYDDARKKQHLWFFVISALFGLAAIAVGIYLPASKNSLHEWIGTGFMLGGLISLFGGTIIYFSDMERYLRPVTMLVELVIIIYIAYKKLNTKK
jgi:hypothetical protein